MTPAIAIAKLAALGLSAGQLESAAVILDAVAGEASAFAARQIEEYRARERERKKRWRDAHPEDGKRRKETDGDGSGRTETPKDAAGSLSPFSPTPPLSTIPPKQPIARGTRIPADFWPDESIWQLAASLGFTKQPYTDQIERMKDHFGSKAGKDATKTDWNMTARNWIKRAADDKQRRPAYGAQKPASNSIAGGFAEIRSALDERIRREGGDPDRREDFERLS